MGIGCTPGIKINTGGPPGADGIPTTTTFDIKTGNLPAGVIGPKPVKP